MKKKIISFFGFPKFEDFEKSRVSRIIHIISIGLFCAIILPIIHNWYAGKTSVVYALCNLEILIIVTVVFNFYHKLKLASNLLSISLIITTHMLLLFSGDGSHDIAIIIYPGAIIIGGLLLEKKFFIINSFLSMISISMIIYFEIIGINTNNMSSFSSYQNLIDANIIIIMTTLIVGLLTENLKDSLNRAQRNESKLIQNKDSLEQQTENLKKSEEKFRSIIELAVDAIFICDSNGKINEINNKACELTNFKREELCGKNLSMLFSEAELNRLPLRFDLLREGKSVNLERNITRKDFRLIPVEMHSKMLPDNTIQSFFRDVTQRKQNEEALRLSEKRFKALSNAAFESIAFTENGLILDVNDQMTLMFGYIVDELIGKPVIDLVAPESKDLVKKTILSETELHYEYMALRKDGIIFPVEARAKIIEFEGINLSVTAIQDISERIIAQESVRKNAEHFRAMIQNLSDIINIVDENEIVTYESPSSHRILGYEENYFIGKSPFDYVHPEDLEKVLADFKEVIKNDSDGLPTEYRFRHSSGKYLCMESVAKNLFQDASVKGILITSRDISERRQSEELLRESDRQFRAFLNSTEDLAFLKDSDGRYIYANYAMCESFRLNEDEIIGKTDFELLPLNLAEKYKEIDSKALSSDEIIIYEEIEGDLISEIRKFKILLKNNKYGIGGIARDITNRKKLERQVIQSEKMAVVGQLSGGIAHDLNNILTVLIGNTELLDRKIGISCKKVVGNYIESLFKANMRAKNIVLQILAFSKRQHVEKEIVDLDHLVNDMEKMLSRLIPENIKILKKISGEKLCINADVSQVEQIIMNLVINSRDSINENGIIEIATKTEKILFDIITRNGIMKPGDFALLIIKDNGTGIPYEIMDKIFDPFFTTKDIGKGTGLGLSIVLNNIIKNDAYLNFYSEINKGTEFKIYFPIMNLPEPVKEINLGGLEIGNGEIILVVEDDESIRFLLTEYLESLNYKIKTARNGLEALKIIEIEKVNAILTDITMPEMGGKELFIVLQQRKINIPVIAMSGYYHHSELKNAGFEEILDKPLDMTKVSEIFHKIFNIKISNF